MVLGASAHAIDVLKTYYITGKARLISLNSFAHIRHLMNYPLLN